MQDQIFIQIRYSKQDENGVQFNDALYLTQAEYEALNPEELDARKIARFNAWKAHVAAQSLLVSEEPAPIDEAPAEEGQE